MVRMLSYVTVSHPVLRFLSSLSEEGISPNWPKILSDAFVVLLFRSKRVPSAFLGISVFISAHTVCWTAPEGS